MIVVAVTIEITVNIWTPVIQFIKSSVSDIRNFLFDTCPEVVRYSDMGSVKRFVGGKDRGELERYLWLLGTEFWGILNTMEKMRQLLSLDFMPKNWVRYWFDLFKEEYREDLTEVEQKKWLLDLLSKVKSLGTVPGTKLRIESWTNWKVEIYRAWSRIFKSNSSLTVNWIDYPELTHHPVHLFPQ